MPEPRPAVPPTALTSRSRDPLTGRYLSEAQLPPPEPDDGAERAERLERRWATLSVSIIAVLIVMAGFAGIRQATMSQSRLETADPRTLHLSGEFIESNLGSAVEADGSVTVRAIGQQYSFTPQCVVVPAHTPVTFRATSADVVHGLLIEGTNINATSCVSPGIR